MTYLGHVLVSGSGTGIGRAVVEALANKDYPVYAAARKEAHLKELASIRRVESVRLDVTSPEMIREAADYIERKGTGLYGLVNCAGTADIWPLIGSSEEDLIRIFDVNVFGMHRLTRALLPLLFKSRGRIVNIGSLGGIASAKPMGAYCMTKFAVEAYSEVLASELQRYGVKVAVIEPGDYRTNLVDPIVKYVTQREPERALELVREEETEAKKWLEETYIRNFGKRQSPQPVASAVLHALTASRPRFRYAIAPTADQLVWALNGLAVRLVQANAGGGEHALSKSEMHGLLDRALEMG